MIPLISPVALYLFAAFTSPIVGIYSKKARNAYVILVALAALASIILLYPGTPGGIETYWLGGWTPTETIFGIALVLDAFSWMFLLLVGIMGFCAALYSYRYVEGDENQSKYYALLCILCAGMSGVILTGDMFNLFVFLEVTAFSAVSLVAFRKGKNALAASFNYLALAGIATAFILIGIMLLYGETGTLNMAHIATKMGDSIVAQVALVLLVAGFALEAAIFPVHNWLPDAHSGAPSSISALLSGVVVKMGVYGLLRTLFTVYLLSGASGLILVLGLGSMFVASILMLAQNDLKRLLAYSTISQVGYILFGVGLGTYMGIAGGLFHLVNHAIFKGLLFFTAGAVISQVKTKNLDEMGGLAQKMPWTTLAFAVGALAVSGVPPFNGFASKWVLYNASFEVNPALTAIALFCSALTLAAMLKAFHGAFLGKKPSGPVEAREAPWSMLAPMLLLALLCVLMGLFPEFVLEKIVYPAVDALINPAGYISAVFPQ